MVRSEWDGRPDLFVANDGEPNYLYRNDGSGHFTNVAYQAGVAVNEDGSEQANMGVALGDYLHTGRFSIGITHFSEEYAALYRNDGDLNFTDVSYSSGIAQSTVSYVGWGDAFFDLDNDGWPDFFMVNGHVYPQVNVAGIGTNIVNRSCCFLISTTESFGTSARTLEPPFRFRK